VTRGSTERRETPNTVPWPLYIWGAAICGGLALKYLAPLPFGYGDYENAWRTLGWAMILGAVAIDLWALATFRRHRTTPMPHQGANALITDGPFAVSRNPLYLSHTLLTAGIGVAAHTLWPILFAPLALLAARHLAVEREEQHLEARFGDAWRAYAARVPRWLGRAG
jgi:protein-S-isoprenylcysteine O-methyltransferase Ste14